MAFILILMLVGISLLLVEMLLASSVWVSGILGVLSLAGACFYTFAEFGTAAGTAVTVFNSCLVVVMSVLVIRSRIRKRLSGGTVRRGGILGEETVSAGDAGRTVTDLSPSGMAEVGGCRIPVTALEGKIERDTEVEVVLVEDGRVYVSPVGEDF